MTTLHHSRGKLILSGAFLLIGAPVMGLFSLFARPIGMITGLCLILRGPLMPFGPRCRRASPDLAGSGPEGQTASHNIVGPDLIRALAFLLGPRAERKAEPRVKHGVTDNSSMVRH